MALLHFGELVLPVAGQLGLGQLLDLQPAQQGHQLEGLRGRDELAAFAVHVLLHQQAFDDRCARRRSAEALLLHGLAQLVVVDQLAGAFHGAQQRGFGIARRRLGLQRVDVDLLGAHHFARLHRHQVRIVLLRLAAVDGKPAGLDHHLAVGLKAVARALHGDRADARRDHEFSARIEHREKALDDHVVELGFDFGQALRRKQRRDDREVVRHLRVVEDALVRLHVALADRLARMRGERTQRSRQALLGDHLHRFLDDADVVLGQVLAVSARVGQHLVLFVQGLRDRQRRLGREAEARIGFALQRGQVVQARRALRTRLGLFADAGRLAAHRLRDRLRVGLGPEAIGAQLGIVGILLPLRVEPLAVVFAGLGGEARLDLPVVARDMLADLFFALDDDRQRRGLHTADRREEESAVARIERRHRACAVDAYKPVGLAAAARRVRQAEQLFVAAQLLEAVADRLRRHALQP